LIRCVYTDLDGTLLTAGSLFRDADGGFTLLPARALEACHRAGVEVVIKSGRRKTQVMEDARLMGQTSYIFEMGCGMVIDGEETMFTGGLEVLDGRSIYDQIEDSGAPRLLLETYAGRLEYHEPWHLNREISHLMRGLVPVAEADALLEERGLGNVRLVDNGAIVPRTTLPDLEGPPHVYHLMPREASKADAVVRHMRARGYAPEECIAVGDSREDLGVAPVVGRFFLVANAVEKDPDVMRGAPGNVEVTEGRNGEGFYEAVIRALAERQS
jgi:phosphoglycolate phosphatase